MSITTDDTPMAEEQSTAHTHHAQHTRPTSAPEPSVDEGQQERLMAIAKETFAAYVEAMVEAKHVKEHLRGEFRPYAVGMDMSDEEIDNLVSYSMDVAARKIRTGESK